MDFGYLGTDHDFLFATTSFMFCNFARRLISRMAFPIAARSSGSVGLPTSRLSLRASVVFAIFVPQRCFQLLRARAQQA